MSKFIDGFTNIAAMLLSMIEMKVVWRQHQRHALYKDTCGYCVMSQRLKEQLIADATIPIKHGKGNAWN
jgi:hypothetical protein